MFRSATTREIECVLLSHGITSLPSPDITTPPNEYHKAVKKLLSDRVREQMLTSACKYVIGTLQVNKKLRAELQEKTGLKFECGCFDQGLSCPKCLEVCMNFAEGVLSVLERDFVQLIHGARASVLENRPGVQFLLTGIVLGLLYESLPEKDGMDELVLTVLIIMIDSRTWARALKLYGPSPKRLKHSRTRRTQTVVRHDKDATPKLQSRSSSVTDFTVCSYCNKPFATDDTVQECDCGSVTVRYLESLIDESEIQARQRASSGPDDPAVRSRMRSCSF